MEERATISNRRVMVISVIATLAALLLLAIATSGTLSAHAAPPPPSTNPPLHQATPITAAGFPEHEDCNSTATTDLFHFVLPGGTAQFTAFSATFRLPSGAIVTYTLGTSSNVTLVQGGKGINVTVPAGSTLLSASATSSTPVPFFNLSHTCAAVGSSPSPTPSPSVSPSNSPSPSPSVSVRPSGY